MSSGMPLTPRNETICRVLSFLSAHPDGWFTTEVIGRNLHARVQPLALVLDELVEDDFLANREVGGLMVYGLAGDPECRRRTVQLLESTAAVGRPPLTP